MDCVFDKSDVVEISEQEREGLENVAASQFSSLDQNRCFNRLFLQVQKFLSLLILFKVFKILLRIKFHKVYFIRFVGLRSDEGTFVCSYPQQQSSIVFRNNRDGNAFELIEDLLLSGDEVDKLSYVDHLLLRKFLSMPKVFNLNFALRLSLSRSCLFSF